MNIRNRQLYDELKNSTISAFRILKKFSEKRTAFPSILKEKIIFHRNGSMNPHFVKVPNLYRFISQYEKKILNLSEFNSLSDYINKDKRLILLRKIDENQNQHVPHSALFRFLFQLAEKTGSFKFNSQAFDKLYKEYEDYLYLDTINYQCFSIMINFQSNVEKIKLSNGLVIKKISNIERRKIWRMRTTREFDMFSIDWIIQIQDKVKRGEKFAYKHASRNFNDLITALRLFKVGIVGYKHIYSYPLSRWDETIRTNLVERKFSGKKYILSKSEVHKFKKWWKEFRRYKNLMTKKGIEIAIQRFNYAYERVSLEDKLIDYIIAFESLLLTGHPEKRFRFALNGALLLGKEIKELKERYLYMKKAREFLYEAYDLRSNIVHGSKKKIKEIKINNNKIPIHEFIEAIENYLRKSIKIYLKISNRQGKKEILKKLDDDILK